MVRGNDVIWQVGAARLQSKVMKVSKISDSAGQWHLSDVRFNA
jgi:hypothetical protein